MPPPPFHIDRLALDPHEGAIRVWVGGRPVGRLHPEAVAQLQLSAGDEVSPEASAALLAALHARGAYESGLRRLGRQAMARAHLERRLAADWGGEAARDAVARLARYLDDAAFARAWVEGQLALRPKGAAALLAGLRTRGVPNEVARDAVREAVPAGDAFPLCREAARRYAARCGDLPAAKRRARLWNHLVRRGFDAETVRRVLAQMQLATDEDW